MKQSMYLRSNRSLRQAKGFSLLEILLVLGIAAALIIAAFVIYPKVQASNRAQTESTNVAAIAAGARALYASSSSYANVTNAVLQAAKVFPDSMVAADNTTITNVWGGAVTVAASTAVTNGLSITENNVPNVECTKMATSAGANFTNVSVNGSSIKSPGNALSVAALTTACANTTNVMIFEGL